jgi:hypothetical protein
MILRNGCKHLPDYTVSLHKRQGSSYLLTGFNDTVGMLRISALLTALEGTRGDRVSCRLLLPLDNSPFVIVTLLSLPHFVSDRLCGLVVRVPGYITEMYCASCEVRTEFIYVM